MTHTTTDAAEARALVQDALMDSQYLAGAKAGWNAAQASDPNAAFAAIQAARAGHLTGYAEAKAILATAEAASGAGEREAFARQQADHWLDDMATPSLGAKHVSLMAMAENCIRYGMRLSASLPPATDPAIVRDWRLTAKLAGEHGIRYRTNAALEAFLAALAAAPTIPATGADVRVGETLAERDRRIYAQGRKDACEEYGLDVGKVATIPATGHAATEGEGA